MDDDKKPDRRGTFWDWPVGWVLAGVLLLLISASNGATGGVLIGLILAIIGVVVWLARRGSLRPR